jgi:hypothetical protein
MADASKEQLDKAHDMGQRDAAAGGPPNPPNDPNILSQDLERQEEENDAYRHGHDAVKDKK